MRRAINWLCRLPALQSLRLRWAWRRHGWSAENPSPISFSQVQEDLVVEALLGRVDRLIDIGANDGITYSNTCKFVLQGSAALLVEPDPANFRRLERLHRGQPGVHCVSCAVSDTAGELPMTSQGLFSAVADSAVATSTVRCETFAALLASRAEFLSVDLLSVDVEGHELSVFRGVPFDRFHARCIVIETHEGSHPDWPDLIALLGRHGYREVLRNPLNSYFLPAIVASTDTFHPLAARFAGHRVP